MLCIKSTSLFVLAITLGLALGAAPHPAAAQTAGNVKCNGCINSKDVKNNGLKSKDIKDGQVKNADLGTDSVTGDKIAGGAVGSSEVAGESIPATDLQNEAGANFADGQQNLELLTIGEEVVVRSLPITAPTGGIVIVNASGHFALQTAGRDSVLCSITTGDAVETSHVIRAGDLGVESSEAAVPFGASRGFVVPSGSTDFNLVCRLADGEVRLHDSSLTAMFFPTPY